MDTVLVTCKYTRSAQQSCYTLEDRFVEEYGFEKTIAGRDWLLEVRLTVEPDWAETYSPDELAKFLGFKESDFLYLEFEEYPDFDD